MLKTVPCLSTIREQPRYRETNRLDLSFYIPTCWRDDIVELCLLLAATAGPVVVQGVRVALPVPVAVPVPLLGAVSVGVAVAAGQSVGGDGPRGRRVTLDRARGPALLGGGVRGSPSHLGPVNHTVAKDHKHMTSRQMSETNTHERVFIYIMLQCMFINIRC